MQASVRTADRVIVQYGQSLAERADCQLVELSDQQLADLRAAIAQPHGLIYLTANGTVTFDPPPPPPPPPADQAAFDTAVSKLRATFGTSRTVADVNLCLDAVMVILRRIYRELH
jgi:hypothetical protein